MSTTGIYTISDLLEVYDQTIIQYGEDRVAEVLNRDLARFNARVSEMLGQLATPILDKDGRLARYGTSIDAEMVELDEFGQPPAQKERVGENVGFPLRKYGFAVGWTRDYMLNRTPADAAVLATKSQKAYLRSIRKTLRSAVFVSSNYDFVDRFVDKVTLPVKRFLNADGDAIPDGPLGETFDGSTHTHYLAEATLSNAGAVSLVDTVTEHGHVVGVKIYINKANQAAWEALTDFEKYPDPRMVYRVTDTPGQTLDLQNMGNRAIGIFHEAEVWIKPWIPSGYAFCFAIDGPTPLRYRQHHVSVVRGLRIAFEMDDYPLRADLMESYWGFGVMERDNGAVLDFGNASYTDPTITS